MGRVYNFSAGPAVLPEEVLKEAADEMLDYKGTGMSVMEMSHRSKAYDEIIKDAEKDIRDLMNIPDNYKVLFLQGGASQQFAMIPMNLMKNKKAAYIVTGQWAKKAYQEAKMYGDAVEVASSADKTFSYIPDCSDLDIPEDLDYTQVFDDLMAKYTEKTDLVKVKTTNMGSLFKLEYRIVFREEGEEKNMIDQLRCRNGNLEILCSRAQTGREEL